MGKDCMDRSNRNGWKAATGSYIMSISPEERYRLIAEFTFDWIFLEMADGTFGYVSPACETITGYSPEDFIHDPELYFRIIHPEDRPRICQHRCLPDTNDTEPMEYRIIHRDGSRRWISHLCQAVRNKQGEFIGCRGSNRDITARKEYEVTLQKSRQQLMDLKEQLEAKNKELESIIGVVSHDLRTPLVTIHGFSGEIAMNCRDALEALDRAELPMNTTAAIRNILDKEIPECLNYIGVSAKAMDRLVRSLVKVARAGMARVNPEQLDMNELISTTVDSIRYRAREAGTTLEVEPLPECFADREMIAQVFANLIDNAVKFIPPDRPGRVRITGRLENGRSVYMVEDNGAGIAPEYRQKIFDLFARLKFEQSEGEGIGLAVVKRIVDQNNGTVRVESEEGRGSRFFVSLPANTPS